MTNLKTIKRTLLSSVVALILCFTMLLGTTFAWFTDSVTSSNNIIQTGTLDVEMYWAKGTEDPESATWADASEGAIFNYDLWEPGYTEVRHIKIANVGSLALKYQINIVANGEVSELADVIDVYYLDPAAQLTDRADIPAEKKLGTLSQVLEQISTTASGSLPAGENHTITLALKMQESAGNEYQGLAIGSDFSVQLFATQYTYESDSFDNQYDENAEYDMPVRVSNAEQLVSALETVTPGTVIDATGVSTDMSTLGTPSGGYTVLDVSAGTTIKGITLAFGSNQPIKTNVNEDVTEGEIVFENCTFLSSGSSDAVYFQSGADAAGVKLVFNNCTFAAAQVIVADNSGGGVEFNNCTFNLNSDGYGLVLCMGGNHTFNNCEFKISDSESVGSSSITKYGQINMYSENETTTVTLNQCTNVPSVNKYAYRGTNTFVNNP